jgi:hypothetical protein
MAQQDPAGMARFKQSQLRRERKAQTRSDIRQQNLYTPFGPQE